MVATSAAADARGSTVAAPAQPTDDGRPSVVPKMVLGLVLAACYVAMTYLLYAASVHAAPGNSDGATVILEGQSFAHGNLTLDHWALSLDSFWLVDVPVYALLTALVGVHPYLLHLVPALVASAVVVVGAGIAWTARPGPRSTIAGAAGALTVAVLLGLPTHAFAEFFVMGPLHVTTTLWCLVAFLALRKGGYRLGWWIAVALLAAGIVGDFQTVALGSLPLGLAGCVMSVRERSLRSGLPQMSVALASVVGAAMLRACALVVGTFSIARNPPANLQQIGRNVPHIVTYGASLAGVGWHPFGTQPLSAAEEAAHAVGLGLIAAAVLLAAFSIVQGMVRSDPSPAPQERQQRYLDDVLTFAFLGGCGVFAALSLSASGAYGRYLSSAMICGAILAGRLVVRLTLLLQHRAEARHRWRASLVAVAVIAAVTTAGYGATFNSTLSPPKAPQIATRLSRYLEHHHLTRGIGDYWSASIVTVESSGRVEVRPVIASLHGGSLERYLRQSSSGWYSGGFQFLVFNAKAPWGGVGADTAIHTFGLPSHVRRVGPYRVYTWSRHLHVAARPPAEPVAS